MKALIALLVALLIGGTFASAALNSGVHATGSSPVPILRDYLGRGLGPHGETWRWNYTVPAGHHATLVEVWAVILRTSPCSVVNEAFVSIVVVHGSTRWEMYLPEYSCAAGAETYQGITFGNLSLGPGDQVWGGTGDSSTGGAHTFQLAAALVETST